MQGCFHALENARWHATWAGWTWRKVERTTSSTVSPSRECNLDRASTELGWVGVAARWVPFASPDSRAPSKSDHSREDPQAFGQAHFACLSRRILARQRLVDACLNDGFPLIEANLYPSSPKNFHQRSVGVLISIRPLSSRGNPDRSKFRTSLRLQRTRLPISPRPSRITSRGC